MNQKLEWATGETKIITFNGTEPTAEGEGKYGHWVVYECVWNGTLYSYFPAKSILSTLQTLLTKTRLITIEKSVRDGARGPITNWRAWAADAPPASSGDKRSAPVRAFENSLVRDDATNAATKKDESIARAVGLKASVDMHSGRLTTKEAVTDDAAYFTAWLLGRPLPRPESLNALPEDEQFPKDLDF